MPKFPVFALPADRKTGKSPLVMPAVAAAAWLVGEGR